MVGTRTCAALKTLAVALSRCKKFHVYVLEFSDTLFLLLRCRFPVLFTTGGEYRLLFGHAGLGHRSGDSALSKTAPLHHHDPRYQRSL
jgi:hypothetical protein